MQLIPLSASAIIHPVMGGKMNIAKIVILLLAMWPALPLPAQVWANNGEDKVTRDELRAAADPTAVVNSVWTGSRVTLFGARNEVVNFNLVIEAPGAALAGVRVEFDRLTGPGGALISSSPAAGDGLFAWTGRNIELFYVRYLRIKGLSRLGYENYYDERHVPLRLRRPHDGRFADPGSGWSDRPDHDKEYPDIAVPLELHTPFAVGAGSNQSVWCDIYIPKTAAAGAYAGTVTITVGGAPAWQVPVDLLVRDFALPDLPSSRTMLVMGTSDVNERYLNQGWIEPGDPLFAQSMQIIDRHAQLAHRHKISLIGADGGTIARMDDGWTARLDGSLFTAANGYDGPGAGVGNNVYSIGTYGSWASMWDPDSEAEMRSHTDAWVNWFDAQSFATPTDTFLYLTDESDDYAQQELWAQWMDNNPGPGSRLLSFATISLPEAQAHVPSLDIPCSPAGLGITAAWQAAADQVLADPGKRLFAYNGFRPATACFMTEDDGVALRSLPWGQYKKGIQRWFYWESTYYVNFQAYGYSDPRARANLFQQAQTFGMFSSTDAVQGETGWNYSNGDGVLFYPGTDVLYPADSYGLAGPIASLRLKHWRRGIQDADYLALAAAKDPARTAAIVARMMPAFYWEVGVESEDDPTYVYSDISWPTDPDAWEAARQELADIIDGGSLTLTAPNGWERWNLGETRSIAWSASGYDGPLRLVLFKGGSRFGNIATGVDAAAGSFAWSVGQTFDSGMAPAGSDYRLYLRSADNTLVDPSDLRFALTAPAPQLRLTSPNGGESWPLGAARAVSWNANGYAGTVRLVLFHKGTKIGQIATGIPASQGSYSWTAGSHANGTAPAGGLYSIRLLAGDGSQEDYSDAPFALTD